MNIWYFRYYLNVKRQLPRNGGKAQDWKTSAYLKKSCCASSRNYLPRLDRMLSCRNSSWQRLRLILLSYELERRLGRNRQDNDSNILWKINKFTIVLYDPLKEHSIILESLFWVIFFLSNIVFISSFIDLILFITQFIYRHCIHH